MTEAGTRTDAGNPAVRTLDEEREDFRRRRFLAMPLAGALAWSLVAVSGVLLELPAAVWALFILTGSIASVGMLLSRFTGEDFLARDRPKNTMDALFFQSVFQALLVYAIAIPFFLQDPTSLPLSVGILTGLMWAPVTWMIQHWVGLFHATVRTVLVLATWYALPEHRFAAVPLVIVAVYLVTIVILEGRWRALRDSATVVAI